MKLTALPPRAAALLAMLMAGFDLDENDPGSDGRLREYVPLMRQYLREVGSDLRILRVCRMKCVNGRSVPAFQYHLERSKPVADARQLSLPFEER